tara:strand:+ start:31965 stop:32792 length:828 start_codon:yes stop_codon:yes gene_type:complete
MAPQKPKKPLLDEKSKDQATLKSLQKSDPYVSQILGSASHVTLYEFDLNQHVWHRKNVEGSLFVVLRTQEPKFQFVVLNRLSTENTVEDLLGEFEFELSPPYLLYRSSTEVNGIWFYKQEECDEMSALFNKITVAFKDPNANGMSTESMLAAMGLGTALAAPAPAPVPTPAPQIAPDPREDSVAAFFAAAAGGAAGQAPGYAAPTPVVVPAVAVPVNEKKRVKKEKPAPVAETRKEPEPSSAPGVTRDAVRAAMYKLVSNDSFIDMMVKELKESL